MSEPLSVALVWHMHQPWYRDDVEHRFLLPWVRRRAAKDYLHMLQVLERHPAMRVTVNFVPSLLAQLELYGGGDAADADRELCLRPARDLTDAERTFLVAGARREAYGRRVAMLAPYVALVDRLADRPASGIDVADLRDLQMWTLLAWIDPHQIRSDPVLADLAVRGRGFGEDEKALVDARQLDLLRRVIPALREAIVRGAVEPMTSPYHHPILPLLIDTSSALVASPGLPLPARPLRAPGDAELQVRRGLEHFGRIAGRAAAGMWPPECAVSPAAAALMHRAGVGFAVSDELVLARTLGGDVRASGQLYRPHADASGLTLVFRDAELSNLVGFTYQAMTGEDGARDLIQRLEAIAASPVTDELGRLVTIALDGENFTDRYEENATPFLDALYRGLLASDVLRVTHVGRFLEDHPATVRRLPGPLWTGSWIDGDLRTWIGDAAHTRAWELVRDAREALASVDAATSHRAAHDELLVAEGSDWFWWFGEHHDSGSDAAWDALFRTHLRNAYRLAGLAPPPGVDEPVIGDLAMGMDCAPLRRIDPPGAGEAEWGCAGVAEVGAVFGAMQPPSSSVSRILYGSGAGRLHLRFDGGVPRFARAVIDAGEVGRLVVSQPVPRLSVPVPATTPLDLSITLNEPGRGVEHVPSAGTLHLPSAYDDGRALRVVVTAAECAPLSVAGALAGVVAETVADATALGHQVIVIVPSHRGSNHGVSPGVRVQRLPAPIAGGDGAARIVQGALPEHGVPVLSVELQPHFDRGSIYGSPDDGERYVAFCAWVVSLIARTGFAPDVVHCFEWETAPVIPMLAAAAGPRPPATVLAVGRESNGYVVDAGVVAAAGLAGTGSSRLDLLELGRTAATVVEETPRRTTLHELYARAVDATR